MAFEGKRRGTTVSKHFRLKSSKVIRRRLDRLRLIGTMDFTDVKLANVLIGILKSRGEWQ